MTDITMKRGDTRTVTETVGPTGLGVNGISGWSFWMTVKYDAGDSDANAVFQKLPAAWQVQTPGNATTAGVAICTINPADTSSLPSYQVTLVYDIQAKDASNHIFTLDSGTFIVSSDITVTTT